MIASLELWNEDQSRDVGMFVIKASCEIKIHVISVKNHFSIILFISLYSKSAYILKVLELPSVWVTDIDRQLKSSQSSRSGTVSFIFRTDLVYNRLDIFLKGSGYVA